MGCSSSKAAMGEAPPGHKGPSQADMIKANSPAQSQSPAVAPIVPVLTNAKPAVAPAATTSPPTAPANSTANATAPPPVGNGAVVPIYPVLAADLARPVTTQPSRTDSLAQSGSTSPSHRMAPSVHPSSIHASLPAPLSPSTLSAISRSLPSPLPPVKPGARPAHIHPADSSTGPPRPLSPRGASGPDVNGSQLVGERAAGWKSASQPVSASTTGSETGSAKDSQVPSRQSSFSSLLAVAVPSLNLSDPAAITGKMTDTFLHYSRRRYETGKGIRQSASSNGAASSSMAAATGEESHRERVKDEESIDKKALGQLATDCVLSLLLAIRADINLKVKDQKGKDKKEKEMRRVYLPGGTLEESVEISRYYLQNELQYKHGCITRTMFFYHFARCYKAMFQFEKLTVEREQLVDRWTTLGQQKLEEKKKKKGKEKERGDKSDRESSVSKSHREARGSSKAHKRKKSRQTAPANSISDLMQSTSSKVMQAEKKLTGTLSANKSKELTATLARKSKGDEVTEL